MASYPRHFKRAVTRLQFRASGPSISQTLRRFDLPQRASTAIIGPITDVIRRHLNSAVRRAFIGKSQTIRKSLYVRTSRARGRESRRPFSISFGMKTTGLTDSRTGKSLSKYLRPIQTMERTTVSKPPKSSSIRTRPPELFRREGGREIPTGVVTKGIKPWVEEKLGKRGADAYAIAVSIARKFEKIGMPRQPIISQLIQPKAIKAGGGVSLIQSATDKYSFKRDLIRALNRTKSSMKRHK